jgi:hypothetical protein
MTTSNTPYEIVTSLETDLACLQGLTSAMRLIAMQLDAVGGPRSEAAAVMQLVAEMQRHLDNAETKRWQLLDMLHPHAVVDHELTGEEPA